MTTLLNAIDRHALQQRQAIAIQGEQVSLSYFALQTEIDALSQCLRERNIRCLGVMMDNGPAWAVVDLAAMKAGITLIPIPAFFTPEQTRHALSDAATDAIITDQCAPLTEIIPGTRFRPLSRIAGQSSWLAQFHSQSQHDSEKIAKITYTSGTTGSPKGVCLSQETMDGVATSLRNAIQVNPADRHLCLLPLAVLLENIGGLYAPLLAGARCMIPSLNKVGVLGASGLDVERMYKTIVSHQATSIILLPQMLQALVAMVSTGVPVPPGLRFIAVGGAPVSSRLLQQAQQLGLPVFEGYGLSECASVVAVNTPDVHRPGSVGKVLSHVQVRFADDGEILLRGTLFQGYLNQAHASDEWYASGDLGHLDDDGFLYLTGRKKNCFITSFGRNVAPEWVERELTLSPHIAQAVVFGEARPFNIAVITRRNEANDDTIQQAIAEANQQLPDYAQVNAWINSDEPFTVANQLYTATGRPRRDAVWHHYGPRLEKLYEHHPISQKRTG